MPSVLTLTENYQLTNLDNKYKWRPLIFIIQTPKIEHLSLISPLSDLFMMILWALLISA